jgi:hypothetical protein
MGRKRKFVRSGALVATVSSVSLLGGAAARAATADTSSVGNSDSPKPTGPPGLAAKTQTAHATDATTLDTSKSAGMAVPTDSDVATAQAFAAVSRLRDSLRSAFPDDFAGLYNSGSYQHDAFTVLVTTGHDPAPIQQYVNTFLDSVPQNAQRPPIGYSEGPVSLNDLFSLRNRIVADTGSWKEKGLDIEMVGIDDLHNSVVVTMSQAVANAQDSLAAAYDSPSISVVVHDLSLFVDRFNDVPAWNGGDALVRASNGFGCTSGFGMHNGSTHYVTTAGHCGSPTGIDGWYNTTFSSPSFTPSRRVGSTDLNSIGSGIDAQRIVAPSSNIFFKQTSTKEFVSAAANPIVGNQVCDEGAKFFEKCGPVSSVNNTTTIEGVPLIALFVVDQDPACAAGDSGAPMIWPQSGYTAQGLVTGGDGSSVCIGTQINEAQFAMAASVNTVSNP